MKMTEQLADFMSVHGFNQSQIAAQLGFSTATVNQYVQGKYKGDSKRIDKLVGQMIERHAQKRRETAMGFVMTPSAQRIHTLIDNTHASGDIQLVIGEAGLGKTLALKEYAKTHDDVVLIEVEPTFNAKVLLTTLCEKLGIPTSRGNHDMMISVVKKLAGSGWLLIFDEAELLAYKPLEIIRRIHDMAGVGVVLAGMPRLRANLRGKRGEYKQLYSRVGFCCDLKLALDDADIIEIIEAHLGTDAHNKPLVKAAEGNARRLSKLIRGIQRYATTSGNPINGEVIKQFADMLIS